MNAAGASRIQVLKQALHTRADVVRYIDRVRHLYPYGLAKVEVPAEEARDIAPTVEVSSAHRLTFVIYGEGETLSEDLDLLLTSIITRGLELERSGVNIVCAPPGDEEELRHILLKEALMEDPQVTNLMIVMGSPLFPSGTWVKEDANEILHTRGLGEIERDKGIKREFWGHLKAVLSRLAAYQPS